MYDRTQSLMLNVNIDSLKAVYWELMKNGVAVEIGILYGENLDENLKKLLIRISNCSYFPQPQDWFQRRDALDRYKKYISRAFEDMIVQYLFGKLLESIYEPKKQHFMATIREMAPIRKSHAKLKIFLVCIEIDAEKFITKINQENLIRFLEQEIYDKFFVRYFRRLLESGVKLLGECTDSKSESTIFFLSMMRSVCEYYILQILGCDQELGLTGEMCVRQKDKNLCYMFDKSSDAKIIYRRLYRRLKELGLDISKDNICTLSHISDKKQFSKVSPSRRTITRARMKYRREKVNLTNKLS